MSVQNAAEPSQKFTWPGVSANAPALTVAVSVTGLPEATELTTLVPDVTASVVVDATFCADAATTALPKSTTIVTLRNHSGVHWRHGCSVFSRKEEMRKRLIARERTMANLPSSSN